MRPKEQAALALIGAVSRPTDPKAIAILDQLQKDIATEVRRQLEDLDVPGAAGTRGVRRPSPRRKD